MKKHLHVMRLGLAARGRNKGLFERKGDRTNFDGLDQDFGGHFLRKEPAKVKDAGPGAVAGTDIGKLFSKFLFKGDAPDRHGGLGRLQNLVSARVKNHVSDLFWIV